MPGTTITQYLADAKTLIAEGNKLMEAGNKKEGQEKLDAGFLSLYRSHKAMPKNKPLIKYLSEEGIKSGMLKPSSTICWPSFF